MGTKYRTRRIDDHRWQVEPQGGMRVPGVVYASERLMDTAACASDAALRDLNDVYFQAPDKCAFAAKGGQAREKEEMGEAGGEGGAGEEALPERTLTAPAKLKPSARRGNAYSSSMRKAVIVNKVLQRMQNRELYASLRYARVCGVRCV